MQRKESLQVGELGTPKWQEPLISYTKYGVLPSETKERATIRGRAPRFYYNEVVDILYYQSYDGILLRCLDNNKALAILEVKEFVGCINQDQNSMTEFGAKCIIGPQ